ncbi:acyltransferase [Bradyrhizobium daqingense]|uniref:Peptidoglycan/LPS O-acetylase OafA/YrhL n=1 Tax=Bradyrhizobium daqingense TaxID=993502 RepID=A0A562KF97_9BRAD|nr:acyltransferase family protein [Bradyrhizobium daqingense]TWH94037.1 peptidoglycan/LPS O-acetylase OafA/YrhL [Bradyrhizobium daqingense]UFS90329.1 acyltransferase [Bradyrhizobium daqingense]
MKYRPDIDGLRAFAVLSVILYHAFPSVVRGGFVGVDVFFVISGFLISSILFREIGEHRFSFSAFYGRRIRRIFPALAVCLAAVLTYGLVVLTPDELAQLGEHVFFGAGFLSNIVLWSESGYFDTAATQKPLLHLWSLGIEEQFYIFWPVLLWFAFKAKAKTAALLGALLLASFAANVFLSATNISAAFYLPISRFWELAAGAALAWHQINFRPDTRSWISFAGLAALLVSALLFSPAMQFPGWLALLPVAGTVAIISAGPEAMVNRVVFSNRIAISIGLISYPLYIWHWPLLSYSYIIRLGKPPTPLLATLLLAVAFILAWATYRFVEYPIRFGTDRQRRTQIVAASMAAAGACGLIVWAKAGFPERFAHLPGVDARKISKAKLDSDFKPTAGMKVLDRDWTLVTHIGRGERKVALSGDSLLFHFGARVQQLADDGVLTASTYFVVGPRCPPVPEVIQQDKQARCRRLPEQLLDLVRQEKIQTVVLGAAWSGYGVDDMAIVRNGQRISLGTKEGADAFYANLEDYIRQLQGLGAKVNLVLGMTVHPRFDPGAMITRSLTGFRIGADVDKPVPLTELRSTLDVADGRLRAVSDRTGAALLDPIRDICGLGDGCSPFFGEGEPKFSDRMHLRPDFVRRNIHFLDPLLR